MRAGICATPSAVAKSALGAFTAFPNSDRRASRPTRRWRPGDTGEAASVASAMAGSGARKRRMNSDICAIIVKSPRSIAA